VPALTNGVPCMRAAGIGLRQADALTASYLGLGCQLRR
jgi:hypothetical protein